MPTEADYKRPFSPKDFRGYFTWSKKFSDTLSVDLYHACHEEELLTILNDNQLPLRSEWSIRLPEHGICKVPGVWTGLNKFVNGNYYGPFLLKFPVRVLIGRKFMAFRREVEERNRYFFVQYEAQIPIFSFKGKVWRRVDPRSYFNEHEEGAYSCVSTCIYDIVLTESIPFNKSISVRGVSHPKCISGKCKTMTHSKARKRMVAIAGTEFERRLDEKGVLKKMRERFPDLEDEVIKIEF